MIGSFFKGNEHGVGTCYLKGKSFVINKYPYSYAQAANEKKPLFDHMPYEGWTIAHVRFATHGKHTHANTHPIIRGDLAVVHNGVFGASELIKAALNKSVKWQGETDTEVGAYMLDQLGVEGFYKAMYQGSGVWMALHRDGHLSVTKLSGDLEANYIGDKDKVVLASEFPWEQRNYQNNQLSGNYVLDGDGRAINFKVYKTEKKCKGNSWHWEGTRYVKGDISSQQETGNSSCRPFMGRGVCAASQPPLPMITNQLRKDPITLWEWLEDDKMVEYLRSLP